MKNRKKDIIIGILAVLLVAAGVLIYCLLKHKEERELQEITGTIIVADPSYLIIETEEEDYLITNIKGTYQIGDVATFTYDPQELDEKETLKKIKINDESLVTAANTNDTENNVSQDSNTNMEINTNQEVNSNNSSQNNNLNSNQNTENNNLNSAKENETSNYKNEVNSADTVVLNYFNELKTEIEASNIKDSVKNGFITVTDFLFYNGKIKGYTFNELSDSAKLKVLSMALYFDNKIDTYFPGYKESISNTANKIYTNIKAQIISTYLNLTTSICTNNSELCTSAKENFNELKTDFSLTWNLLKDIAGDGISNLKNWYEIWSGK